MQKETIATHYGYDTKAGPGAMAVPIYQTTAYDFGSAEAAAARFALEDPGHIYTRLGNPTTDVLESRIAALEEGSASIVTASGQSAIFYSIANLAAVGDNIVVAKKIYGGTMVLFIHTLKRFGIEARVFDSDSADDLENLIDDKTRAIFFETLSNPQIAIPNFKKIVEIADKHGVVTIADNTVPTPIIFQPLNHGIDVVVHSASKYICGQGLSLAGAVVASKNLNAEQRTYYHLVAIEEYMKKAGISFTRPFELDVKSVKKAIEKEIRLELFDSYALSLKNLKPVISFVPFKKGELSYHSPNPLIAVIKEKETYKVQYGNRSVTRLKPQYFEFTKPLDKISLLSDGNEQVLKSGDKFSVKKSFKIKALKNVRVNVIGYGTKSVDESEQEIDKNSLNKSYSIDKDGKIYRVEFYKSENGKEKFAGMILAEFR